MKFILGYDGGGYGGGGGYDGGGGGAKINDNHKNKNAENTKFFPCISRRRYNFKL